jgi:hypothetical protein
MGCSSPPSNKRKDAGLLVFHRHVALWAKGRRNAVIASIRYSSGEGYASGDRPWLGGVGPPAD